MTNKNKQPNLLICLGTSASGKSTFIRHWQKAFPEYEHVDDLPVVMEYLNLEKLIYAEKNKNNLKKKLVAFSQSALFLKDLALDYLYELNVTNNIPTLKYCSPIGDNYFEITNPHVWDDVIRRTAQTLTPNKKYIFEFARGHHQGYVKNFQIQNKDIYPRTLSLLFEALPNPLSRSCSIIHMSTGFSQRLKRNNARRMLTGQDFPNKVLCDVFKHDVFEFDEPRETSKKTVLFHNISINERVIPTTTIFNDTEIAPDSYDSYFENIVKKTSKLLCANPKTTYTEQDQSEPQ